MMSKVWGCSITCLSCGSGNGRMKIQQQTQKSGTNLMKEIVNIPECDQDDMETSVSRVSDNVHTVTFKCIGSVCDVACQEALRIAWDRLQEGSSPTYSWTPQCIMILKQLHSNATWMKRIGYIVWEALSEIHVALKENKITEVKFTWIKYITTWTKSGPGYFAEVNISKKDSGEVMSFQAAAQDKNKIT